MDPATFHSQLLGYSQAADEIELSNMVMGQAIGTPVHLDYGKVKIVSSRIDYFLKENSYLLDQSDLPALRNLSTLIHQLELKSGFTGTLEKTIDVSFAIINEKIFHKKLSDLAASDNTTELVSKLLAKNYPENDKALPVKDVGQASDILEGFIRDNWSKLNKSDLPAFEKLKSLAQLKTSQEHIIKEAIKLLKKDPLPPEVLSLVAEYSADEDAMKLSLATTSPKSVIATINSRDRMLQMIETLKDDPDAAKAWLFEFFKHASDSRKELFFNVCREECANYFINTLLFLLPTDLPSLNFGFTWFYNNILEDRHIAVVYQRFNKLEDLTLSRNKEISDKSMIELANSPNMSNLKKLDLESCSKITDLTVTTMAYSPNMSELRILCLAHLKITDAAITSLAKSPYLVNLQSLILHGCKNISDIAVVAIAESRHLINLQSLDLDDCNITEYAVTALTKSPYLVNLQSLKLYGCENISDIAVVAIAESRHLINLHSLDLSQCNITDYAIIALAKSPYLVNLQSLHLNTSNITDLAITVLAKSPIMKHLKVLVLPPSISDGALEMLRKSTSDCKVSRLQY